MFSRRPGFRFNRGRVAVGPVAPGGGGGGDTDPPGMTWAVLADGTGIRGTMDEDGDETSTPAPGDFALTGTHATIASAAWASATELDLAFTSGSRVTIFETPLLSYTAGANPLRDLAENNLPNFTDTEPTNASEFLQGAVLIKNPYRAASLNLSGTDVVSFVNEVDGSTIATSGSPQYQATGLNGRPAVDYDGTDDRDGGTDAAILAALDEQAAYHYFCIAQTDNDDLGQALISTGVVGSANGRSFCGITAVGNGRHRVACTNDAGVTTNIDGVDTAPDTSPHVYEYFGDTTQSMRLDGGALDINGAAWNPGTTTATSWVSGARPGASYDNFWNGRKAFEVLFPLVLTTGTNSPANVRAYLYFLSGLTGL